MTKKKKTGEQIDQVNTIKWWHHLIMNRFKRFCYKYGLTIRGKMMPFNKIENNENVTYFPKCQKCNSREVYLVAYKLREFRVCKNCLSLMLK